MDYYLTHPWSIFKRHPRIRFNQMTGKKKLKLQLTPFTPWMHMGGTGIALLNRNLGTRCVLSGLTLRPGRFTAGEKDPPPLPKPTEQEGGWVPEPVWSFLEERKTCCLWPASNT